MTRPATTEHASYYGKYIELVPEDDIVGAMKGSLASTFTFLAEISETEASVVHAPYAWTIKQVIGHLCDCERVFGYRALRFGRGDSTPVPGFDENVYANAAGHDKVPISRLVGEFENLRRSHIAFFEALPEEAWVRRGTANNAEVSVRALAYILVGHERHHAAIVRKRLGKQ